MTGYRHGILTAAFAACVIAAPGAECRAELTGRQQSLTGVKLVTVQVSCSDLAKEAGLDEEAIRKSISRQLEDAGIGVVRHQIWATLPGRCRFRATVKVYKPLHLDTLMYNLKGEFVQTVALARLPETKIDAATWQRTWFAHGSQKRLAEVVPHNLRVLTAAFIRDHRLANPKAGQASNSSGAGGGSATTSNPPAGATAPEAGFITSKTSSVFHKSDCRWAQSISTDNLVSYGNRDEAVRAGKRPCKQCNP
ncbi:MAG: hypothetical protein ACYSWQ_05430 [Planctomycetota bacterium]|jgi:hypothetical protein